MALFFLEKGSLRFLEDYLRGTNLAQASDIVDVVRATVMRKPGMTLLELLHLPHRGVADVIYSLIVADLLYVDLFHALLPEPERVQVFPDRNVATAVAVMTSSPMLAPRPSVISLAVGMPLWWTGTTVFNPGETEVTLLSPDHHLQTIPTQSIRCPACGKESSRTVVSR